MATPLWGCDQAANPPIDDTESALVSENGLASNGLASNGLASNGLASNGLASNGLASNGLVANAYVLGALRDPTSTGTLTRMFFRYVVSCALPAGRAVSYQWTDTSSVTHTDIDQGLLGLAPSWETSAPDEDAKELVSACLGARTNSKGVTVPISMRADHVDALAVSDQERGAYSYGEGTFWGNMFNGNPYMYSCSRAPYGVGLTTSQYVNQGRTCAASDCGLIKYLGRCLASDHSTTGQACFDRDKDHDDWSSNCFSSMAKGKSGGSTNTITTWLMP